jgi:hypothetical protein
MHWCWLFDVLFPLLLKGADSAAGMDANGH